MTGSRRQAAEALTIATAAHLSMITPAHENWSLWVEVLRKAAPEAKGGARAAAALVSTAGRLAEAKDSIARDAEISRLHADLKQYFARVAAHRLDAFEHVGAVNDG